ncbi:unannotated protein [freshwater metagenome]|uniref:Unannotated protein n=1 Tax=freshwater metagenome TaxID=449393 RepID=A0A6J6BTN4_9ZZZZ
MNRHHILWLQDVVAVKQFAGGRMAGNVNLGVTLVNHVGAQLGKPVDHAINRVFVTRNQRRSEDDGVTFADLHVVFQIRHP